MDRLILKRFFLSITVVLCFAALAFLLAYKSAKASSHLRQDTAIVAFSTSNFCISGDVSAHYTNGRYVTFPQLSTSSWQVLSSSYNSDPVFLCNNLANVTTIDTNDAMPEGIDNSVVCLWASNPLPTYDCRADTTPPTITNLTANSITQTGATITWTTNESATHTIKYGTSSGSYDSYPNSKSAGSGTSASGAL